MRKIRRIGVLNTLSDERKCNLYLNSKMCFKIVSSSIRGPPFPIKLKQIFRSSITNIVEFLFSSHMTVFVKVIELHSLRRRRYNLMYCTKAQIITGANFNQYFWMVYFALVKRRIVVCSCSYQVLIERPALLKPVILI